MQKLIPLILLISSLFSREYIAVIDFEGFGVNNDEARALTQRLTSEIIALEVYQVVERSEMKRLLDEQKFQYSGCVDTKCAVEIGKMIGAKYMIVGSISKIDDIYSIDTRLINVESSEAYVSGQYTAQESLSNVLVNGMKSVAYQLCEIDEKVPTVSLINRSDKLNKKWGLEFSIIESKGSIPDITMCNYGCGNMLQILEGKSGSRIGITRDFQLLSNNFQFHYSVIIMQSMKPSLSFYINYKSKKTLLNNNLLLGLGYFELGEDDDREFVSFKVGINRIINSNNLFDVAIGINTHYNIGRKYFQHNYSTHSIFQFECVLNVIGIELIEL